MDIFKQLQDAGFKPTIIEDTDSRPAALNGKYVAVVTECGRKQGTSEKSGNSYDFYSIKFKVVKTVDGTAGDGRYLDKTYFMADSEYGTALENLGDFVSMLYTITGEDIGFTEEDVAAACEKVKGQFAKLSVYPRKKDGEIVRDDRGYPRHTVKVVRDIKIKGKVVTVNLDEIEKELTDEVVPF